jgi:hypothetical protein
MNLQALGAVRYRGISFSNIIRVFVFLILTRGPLASGYDRDNPNPQSKLIK